MSKHHSSLGWTDRQAITGFPTGTFCGICLKDSAGLLNSLAHRVAWLLSIHTAKLEVSTADINCNPFLHPYHPQSSHTPWDSLSYHVQPLYGAKIHPASFNSMHGISLPPSLPCAEVHLTHNDMHIFPSRKKMSFLLKFHSTLFLWTL